MDPDSPLWNDPGSWTLAGVLTGALIGLALLVNRLQPGRRRGLRRLLGWWAPYVLALLAWHGLDGVAPEGLVRFLGGSARLFQAFLGVALLRVAVFDLVLPTAGLSPPRLTSDLLTGAAYVFVTGAVLSAAGLDLGSAVAASTVVAAALTISLQGTLGNVVGGLALQAEGSVKAGDWIELPDGRAGRVGEVGWRHTRLETRGGDTLVVPNATLLQSPFLLQGRRGHQDGPRRVEARFRVDFRHAPGEVCTAVRDALLASPLPHRAPGTEVEVLCLDLASADLPSAGTYAARVWVDTPEQADLLGSVTRDRVHAALRRAGIPLARPAATLFTHTEDASTEHERAARHRDRALATLARLELFRVLTDDERRELAAQLRFAPFAEGEVLTRQGAVAHWLYVVESGRVDVVTEVEGASQLVYRLEGPDLFGEMGLMTGEPRMASVIAAGPVVCHRLEKAAFERILRDRPELAAGFAAVLVRRRVQLLEVRAALGAAARQPTEASERERIRARILEFFGLG